MEDALTSVRQVCAATTEVLTTTKASRYRLAMLKVWLTLFRRRSLLLLLCLSCVPVAFGADFGGTWMAHIPSGADGMRHVEILVLKVQGDSVTGTIKGPGNLPMEISGQVVGGKISFRESYQFNGQIMIRFYEGIISDDTIQFSRHWEGKRPVAFEATRSK